MEDEVRVVYCPFQKNRATRRDLWASSSLELSVLILNSWLGNKKKITRLVEPNHTSMSVAPESYGQAWWSPPKNESLAAVACQARREACRQLIASFSFLAGPHPMVPVRPMTLWAAFILLSLLVEYLPLASGMVWPPPVAPFHWDLTMIWFR